MRFFVSAFGALGAVVTSGFLGCSSSSSPETPGTTDGGTSDVSVANYSTSACGTCVAQACATPITKCNSDPDCASYLSCLEACGVGADGNVDPTCAAGCPTGTSSSGATAEAALTDCRTMGAGAQCTVCGIDGGGSNPILTQMCTPMTDTTECATCEDDNCCQTYANCHTNPDCHALQGCLVDCLNGVADDAGSPAGGATATETCEYICGLAHPQGLVDWAPRDTCINDKCTVMCENPPMPALDPCVACQYQTCANEFANLNGTPDGFLLSACIAGCPTGSPCEADCISTYTSAKAALDALGACVTQNCPACLSDD